jgi:chemotaxis protein CheX
MLAAYEQSIEEISQSIFATMLGADLFRVEEQSIDPESSLQAAIHIAGGWTGCVVISLSADVSRYAAASMLAISPSEVCDEDVKDTATELANMVGGNLKSLLPGPSFLSLPSMVSGENLGLRTSEVDLIEDVWFACEHGPFRVRVYHKRDCEA